MTPSNGNIFRVTGHLWGEFTGHRWIPRTQRPVTRSFDVFFDLHLNKRLSKQSWGWWSGTPSLSLWRHYNDKNPLWCGWPQICFAGFTRDIMKTDTLPCATNVWLSYIILYGLMVYASPVYTYCSRQNAYNEYNYSTVTCCYLYAFHVIHKLRDK